MERRRRARTPEGIRQFDLPPGLSEVQRHQHVVLAQVAAVLDRDHECPVADAQLLALRRDATTLRQPNDLAGQIPARLSRGALAGIAVVVVAVTIQRHGDGMAVERVRHGITVAVVQLRRDNFLVRPVVRTRGRVTVHQREQAGAEPPAVDDPRPGVREPLPHEPIVCWPGCALHGPNRADEQAAAHSAMRRVARGVFIIGRHEVRRRRGAAVRGMRNDQQHDVLTILVLADVLRMHCRRGAGHCPANR